MFCWVEVSERKADGYRAQGEDRGKHPSKCGKLTYLSKESSKCVKKVLKPVLPVDGSVTLIDNRDITTDVAGLIRRANCSRKNFSENLCQVLFTAEDCANRKPRSQAFEGRREGLVHTAHKCTRNYYEIYMGEQWECIQSVIIIGATMTPYCSFISHAISVLEYE